MASQASLKQSLAGRSLTSYFTGSAQLASFSENRTLRWALANTNTSRIIDQLFPPTSSNQHVLSPGNKCSLKESSALISFQPVLGPVPSPRVLRDSHPFMAVFILPFSDVCTQKRSMHALSPMTETSKEKEKQTEAFKILKLKMQGVGLRWWLSVKESTCQCRSCWFDPWVRKSPWRRQWQPTPVFLPEKSHRQRSLAGYSPWGRKRVRHDLATKPPQFI